MYLLAKPLFIVLEKHLLLFRNVTENRLNRKNGFSAKFTTGEGLRPWRGLRSWTVLSCEHPIELFMTVKGVLEGSMNVWRVHDRERIATLECLKIWRVYGRELKNNYVWIDEMDGVTCSKTCFKVNGVLDEEKTWEISGFLMGVFRERKCVYFQKKYEWG